VSKNCRRELYTALDENKPIITVWESDANKGGCSLEGYRREARCSCSDRVDNGSTSGGTKLVVKCVIDAKTPIEWVRVNEFQLEAFKLILSRLLPALPLTRKLRHRRLYVRGELGVHRLTAPVTVLVCRGNGAAMDVAQELKRASADVPHAAAMQIQEAEQVLNAGSVQIPKRRSSLPSILSNESSNVHLLLYLNKDTFSDGDIGVKGSVAELVLDFMERKLKGSKLGLVMVHEQDVTKGGCPFRELFEQTPEVLVKQHRLFDTLAVPLFPSEEYREISRRFSLRNMGAVPFKRRRRWAWLPGRRLSEGRRLSKGRGSISLRRISTLRLNWCDAAKTHAADAILGEPRRRAGWRDGVRSVGVVVEAEIPAAVTVGAPIALMPRTTVAPTSSRFAGRPRKSRPFASMPAPTLQR